MTNHTDEVLDELGRQISDLSTEVSRLRREPLNEDDIKKIAKAAGKEAVGETFRLLGIDPSDNRDMRETHNDLAWLREFRNSLNAIPPKIGMTVITILIVAICGALWVGVKSNIIGK